MGLLRLKFHQDDRQDRNGTNGLEQRLYPEAPLLVAAPKAEPEFMRTYGLREARFFTSLPRDLFGSGWRFESKQSFGHGSPDICDSEGVGEPEFDGDLDPRLGRLHKPSRVLCYRAPQDQPCLLIDPEPDTREIARLSGSEIGRSAGAPERQ